MRDAILFSQIHNGEGQHLEFIRDASKRSVDAIGRTIVAFLNTEGGTILCGLSSDGTPSGKIFNAPRIEQDLEGRLQAEVTPTSLFTVSTISISGQDVIAIEVPAGRDKPYVFRGGVYFRKGNRTLGADATQLRSLLTDDALDDVRWERRISQSLERSQLDHDRVFALASEAKGTGRFAFDDVADIGHVLRSLSLQTSDGLTNAADVLFAKLPSQRHPQMRVRYTEFVSDATDDRFRDTAWFEDTLLETSTQLFEKLRRHVRTQSTFSNTDIERQDRSTYSLAALREAAVNMLVHRDYSAYSGGARVSVYPDRIEFWNSGQLPEELKVQSLSKAHPSIPINPDIAHVFYMDGLMERTGRGTIKILSESKSLRARRPKWTVSTSGVNLTIYAASTSDSATVHLNPRQNRFLKAVEKGEAISPSDYSERFASDVSARQARRDLRELEDSGRVRREGRTHSTVYVVL